MSRQMAVSGEIAEELIITADEFAKRSQQSQFSFIDGAAAAGTKKVMDRKSGG